MAKPTLHTSICDFLDIEYPVILAGMGGKGRATPPPLVAAVSNAGGLGVMGASALSAEEVDRRIREIRSMTSKPFGVDVLLPASLADAEETRSAVRLKLHQEYPKHVEFMHSLMKEFDLPDVRVEDEIVISPGQIKEQVDVVLEEKVPVFAAGLGDPAWVVPLAREQGVKTIGLVGTVRAAMRQVKAGVDVVVAQGYEAGGHTGRIANFPLIPQVADAVSPTSVLAAGAISDGRGLAAALALGAVGAWVGTAFLTAEECWLPEVHKQQILDGSSSDFVITRSYTGKTARDYKNVVIDAWDNSGLDPLPMPLQGVLMQDFVEAAEVAGRYDLTNNPAGQGGGMLKEFKPAAQIMDEMIRGAVEVLGGLQGSLQPSQS